MKMTRMSWSLNIRSSTISEEDDEMVRKMTMMNEALEKESVKAQQRLSQSQHSGCHVDQMLKEDSGYDESESSSSSFSTDDMNDDSSFASMDGRIPSMADLYDDDDNEEEDDVFVSRHHDHHHQRPSITYMGRCYEASQFQSATPILEEKFPARSSATKPRRRASMSMDISEHLADRWNRLVGNTTNNNTSPTHLSSAPELPPIQDTSSNHETSRTRSRPSAAASNPLRRRNTVSLASGAGGPGLRRRNTVTVNAPKPTGSGMRTSRSSGSLSASVAHHTNTGHASLGKSSTMSQSEHFGSTRRATTDLSMSNTTFYAQPSRPRVNSTGNALAKLFGAAAAPKLTEQELMEQDRLERWGYTNRDVLEIVQDQEAFAKLKRDLKARQAVTNNLVGQKIHVFVRNQKYRQQQLLQAQMQRLQSC